MFLSELSGRMCIMAEFLYKSVFFVRLTEEPQQVTQVVVVYLF